MRPDLDQLSYTRQQAADVTGLSADTIRRATQSGDLPAKRVGRRVVVLRRELAAWLDRQPDF